MKIILIIFILLTLLHLVSCYNITNSSTLKTSIIFSNNWMLLNEINIIPLIKSEIYMF